MTQDYDFSVSFQGQRDGLDVIDITCIPKPDAPIVWGKVVVTVRAADHLPVSAVYYDEDMTLARTMTYGDIRVLGGRTLPARLEMVPADKPTESTVVVYDDIAFDVPLPDDTFSLRALTSQ